MAAASKKRVDLFISPDRLSAAIQVADKTDPREVEKEDVYDLLTKSGIRLQPDTHQEIGCFLETCSQGNRPPDPLTVATGRPAVNGENAFVEWAEEYDPQRTNKPDDGTPIDFYNRQKYVIAQADDLLLTVHPATRGEDGCDVSGEAIKAKAGKPISISPGANVVKGEVDGQFLGTAAGRLLFDGRTLAINPVLEVRGDVDFESGNVDFAGDVKVQKGVLDLFRITVGGSLEVGGLVEGAVLDVKGNAVLRGGAMMKEKGYIHTRGNLTAKILSNARVLCRGDIEIAKEAMNCTILCFGKLGAQHGTLAGGVVVARGGIWVQTLGSVQAKTIVVVGHDPTAEPELAALKVKAEKLVNSAEKVRNTVKPLLAMGKRLSNEHREKCTELLFQADTLETDAQQCGKRQEQIQEELLELCVKEIHVSKLVHADTIVRIGEDYCKIPEDLKGPLKLIVSRISHVSMITAVWPDGSRKNFERNVAPEERKALLDLPTGLPDQSEAEAPQSPSPVNAETS